MRSSLFVFIIVSVLMTQAGCSGNEAAGDPNTTAEQNSETSGSTEFASAADALAEGNRLFDNGETEKAISVLLDAVKIEPDLAEAYFKLGIAYALIEARDDSVTEPVEPLPQDSKIKRPKEVKTNSEKAFENAVAAYKKLLAANKDNDQAHFNLGLAYNKLNEDEEAAKSIREAVKLKPEDTEYQTELGSILIKLAKYHEAVGALKKAIELDETNVKAEELLEKAEAGRKRIDFISLPKDDKKSSNSNANLQKEDEVPDEANKAAKPSDPKRSKQPLPAKSPK